MTPPTQEILPCPACGKEAKEYGSAHRATGCINYHCPLYRIGFTREEWNALPRFTQADMDEALALLRKAENELNKACAEYHSTVAAEIRALRAKHRKGKS